MTQLFAKRLCFLYSMPVSTYNCLHLRILPKHLLLIDAILLKLRLQIADRNVANSEHLKLLCACR